MKDGYIKVAALSPKIRVADPKYNVRAMLQQVKEGGRGRGVRDRISGALHHRVQLRGFVFAGAAFGGSKKPAVVFGEADSAG